MTEKKTVRKVRTSFTVDPDLLAQARAASDNVSSYIEAALRFYMENGPKK